MKGVSGRQLALHLDDFIWQERHGKTAGMAFRNICRDIKGGSIFFSTTFLYWSILYLSLQSTCSSNFRALPCSIMKLYTLVLHAIIIIIASPIFSEVLLLQS